MKKHISDKKFENLRDCIVKAMHEKKAENVVSIDLRKFNNRLAEMFIICHGSSVTQVEAIADYVEELSFKTMKQKPFHREGFENKEWILLDYFDIVVHVFLEEKREFYSIEQLWGDGELVKYIETTDLKNRN
jgi:ribosome-associated protein